MASINKVTLIGNLGQDPEIKYMPSGGAVANVSIATTDSWKDKSSGEMKDKTEWHRVVFFNRLAEIVGEYLRKGSQVYIEGSLRTNSWEDNGVKKYSTEIVAREMKMLGSKSQDDRNAQNYSEPGSAPTANQQYESAKRQTAGSAQNGASQQKTPANQAPQNFDNFDDDIPF